MPVSLSAKRCLPGVALLAFAGLAAHAQTTNPPAALPRWGDSLLSRANDWYVSDEARRVADNVLQYQSTQGAWPKNTDLTAQPTAKVLAELKEAGHDNTIDNGATTVPMRFLALMAQATNDVRYK